MDTVVYVISILMWILCPAIIGLILLQGAAGDISSAFGGGGQLDASLGVGAHRKMAQVTGALAVLFFIMVLFMAYPHRGSFQNVKNAPAPVAPPTEQAKPEAVKPVEPAPPIVQPEPAKPADPAPAIPVQAQPQAEVQPEAAKPVEAAPAPEVEVKPAPAAPEPAKPEAAQPEAVKPEAKPVEPLPVTVPTLAPAPAPAEPAKP